jgi:dTMP kinase
MQSAAPPRTTTELLKSGEFAKLWRSGVVSSLGDWVSLFASLELGYAIGETVGLSAALAGRFLAGALFSGAAGVVADRFDARRVMIVTDIARGLLVIGLLFVSTLLELALLTFVIELFSLTRQPAREAALGVVVSKNELVRGNGLLLLAAFGTAPLGIVLYRISSTTALGGLLSSAWDPWDAGFALDIGTFFLSAVLLYSLVLPARPSVEARGEGWGVREGFTDLTDGLKYVLGQREIRRPILVIVAALFGGAPLFVLGKPFTEQALAAGNDAFTWVALALGLGVLAGVGLSRLTERSVANKEAGIAVGLLLAGVGVIGVSQSLFVLQAAVSSAVAGAGIGVAYVLVFASLHTSVDDDMRGRTFGTLFALGRVGVVAALGLGPLLAELVGTRLTLLLSGMLVLAAGLATVLTRGTGRSE